MIDDDYEYDETYYQSRINEVLQRSDFNVKKLKTAYKQNLHSELKVLLKERNKIDKELENLRYELEVEHFLMFGAGNDEQE